MKKNFSLLFFFITIPLTIYLWIKIKNEQNDDSSTFLDFLNDFATKTTLGVDAVFSEDAVTKATSFIANEEQFRAKAYPDPPGQTEIYSIGYGHQITGKDGLTKSSVIDQQRGLQLLSTDIGWAVACVDSSVKVPLTVNQKVALISLAFNIGCPSFSGSTLVRLLNNGDYEGAAFQFSVWKYAKGVVLQTLVDRRDKEQELFLS